MGLVPLCSRIFEIGFKLFEIFRCKIPKLLVIAAIKLFSFLLQCQVNSLFLLSDLTVFSLVTSFFGYHYSKGAKSLLSADYNV